MGDAQFLFQQAIYKAKERTQTMRNKNTIVYQHTDGRIFRLKVIPSCDLRDHAEVSIYTLKGGHAYFPLDTRYFEVSKFDTIVAGAMCCLYGYLAETTKEDEIARKWQEFENRG